MPKKKIELKMKLKEADTLYLIKSPNDTIHLHNWLKGVDKIVIEVKREK